MSTPSPTTDAPRIATREEWLAARTALLAKERELTHHMDEVNRQRRELPWVPVDKDYSFETPSGPRSLSDLFEGRSQLFVYHFMYGPNSKDGCVGCSFISDHVDGARQHFENHDLKFVAISRAPLSTLQAYKKRMGWNFDWVSSGDSDFNYDYQVSFKPEQFENGTAIYNYAPLNQKHDDLHGVSIFAKDASGKIYHTYSSFARGNDILLGAHNFLDMTPLGRNEKSTMDWVRRHDSYDNQPAASCCGCEK